MITTSSATALGGGGGAIVAGTSELAGLVLVVVGTSAVLLTVGLFVASGMRTEMRADAERREQRVAEAYERIDHIDDTVRAVLYAELQQAGLLRRIFAQWNEARPQSHGGPWTAPFN